MRTKLTILLLSLLCSGCSQERGKPPEKAVDLIVAGKEVTWRGGSTLYVTKRRGTSIQGIRLVLRYPDVVITNTADKGTVLEGPYPYATVSVILYNATRQSTRGGEATREKEVIATLETRL